MTPKFGLWRSLGLALPFLVLACASNNNQDPGNGSGGSAAPSSGGATSSGGSSSVAGSTAFGGAGSGGALSVGGTVGGLGTAGASEGGSSAEGGRVSSGGAGADGSGGAGAGGGGGVGAGGSSGAGAGGSGASGGATQTPPTGKITVWLSGDSTMANDGGATCPVGWGTQFQALFGPNATVVNNAAAGRTIQTWLYDPNVTTTVGPDGECVVSPKTFSTRWQQTLNGMKAGDYLLIEFGINDGSTCSDSGRHVGSALFQSDYVYMATQAKMKGAQAIFLTSTSEMACTGAMVKPNRGFQAETLAAATMAGVPIIQLTQLSAALYTSLGLCPNDGNFASTTSPVGKFFCDDHTHFETAGAAQIAGVVAKALRDQKIGLAAYLK
jgi:lysophospholipase L1-like esterase